MGVRPGSRLRVRTGPGLSSRGEGVARIEDGRVAFVQGAAPEETIVARVLEVKKRFIRASLLSIERPGPARVSAPCRYFGRCGGCTLMHIDPEAQVAAKWAAGLETLRRVGQVGTGPLRLARLAYRDTLGLRSRARLGWDGQRLGFRAARSSELVDIEHCLALHPRLDWGLSKTREAFAEVSDPQGLRSGHIAEIEYVTNGVEVALALPPPMGRFARALSAHGLRVDDEPFEVSDVAGRLWIRPQVFQQASLHGNDALLRQLDELLPNGGQLAVDLFAGSGNLTRLLARRFRKVIAVESSAAAVGLGRRLRLPNVEWRQASAQEAPEANLVVVDPPRAGLPAPLREALRRNPPELLIYVSCDVGTLARDLRALGDVGAGPDAVFGLDLYPQTPHMEWIVRVPFPGRGPRETGGAGKRAAS